jgi:hypothetical protein
MQRRLVAESARLTIMASVALASAAGAQPGPPFVTPILRETSGTERTASIALVVSPTSGPSNEDDRLPPADPD